MMGVASKFSRLTEAWSFTRTDAPIERGQFGPSSRPGAANQLRCLRFIGDSYCPISVDREELKHLGLTIYGSRWNSIRYRLSLTPGRDGEQKSDENGCVSEHGQPPGEEQRNFISAAGVKDTSNAYYSLSRHIRRPHLHRRDFIILVAHHVLFADLIEPLVVAALARVARIVSCGHDAIKK